MTAVTEREGPAAGVVLKSESVPATWYVPTARAPSVLTAPVDVTVKFGFVTVGEVQMIQAVG